MEENLSMNDQFMDIINRIIEDNIDNEYFSVKDLAKRAGLSRSMLHRKLKKLVGKSASDMITEKRLLRAKELLEKDVATASEIAYRVGFSSPSYFNKVFKKHFNISPGQVRKHSRIDSNLLTKSQELESKDSSQSKFYGFKRKILIILFSIIGIGVVANFAITKYWPSEISIAVLPINNYTGQSENDYFVDGLHYELISELGKFNSLRVIGRTSTLMYRDSNMLLKDFAKKMGVKIIVESSFYKVGDSIRLLTRTINVFPKERQIFSTEYNDVIPNVLKIQSSAAKDIAQEIGIKFSKDDKKRLSQTRTVDPETYKAYLRGMYYINKSTPKSFEEGISYLLEAIDKDPGDPFAYAALALGYANVGHGQLNAKEAFLRAESAANTAIKLDPTIDEAYTALAILYLYYSWDWTKAKEAFEGAIANNPNNALAHAQFAWYHVLFDDMEKSIYHAKEAAMINPLYVSYSGWLSLLYYHNKDYDEAELWAKKALTLKDSAPYANLTLGWICLYKKEYQQAIEYHEKLPENNYFKTHLGYAYVKAGQRDKALVIWKEMEAKSKIQKVNFCYRGMMAAYLGFTDLAFEYLNIACDKKSYPINYINSSPCTEDIRDDFRYNELLQKMNLPTNKVLITSNK